MAKQSTPKPSEPETKEPTSNLIPTLVGGDPSPEEPEPIELPDEAEVEALAERLSQLDGRKGKADQSITGQIHWIGCMDAASRLIVAYQFLTERKSK